MVDTITEARLRRWLGDFQGPVRIHPLPNLLSMNVELIGWLDRGVAANLAPDPKQSAWQRTSAPSSWRCPRPGSRIERRRPHPTRRPLRGQRHAHVAAVQDPAPQAAAAAHRRPEPVPTDVHGAWTPCPATPPSWSADPTFGSPSPNSWTPSCKPTGRSWWSLPAATPPLRSGAAAHLAMADGDPLLLVMPSDHLIADKAAFSAAAIAACELAARASSSSSA